MYDFNVMVGTTVKRVQLTDSGSHFRSKASMTVKNCPTGNLSRKVCSALMVAFVDSKPLLVDGKPTAAPSYHKLYFLSH